MEEGGKFSTFLNRVKGLGGGLFGAIMKSDIFAIALGTYGAMEQISKFKTLISHLKNFRRWFIRNVLTSEVMGIVLGVIVFLAFLLFIIPFFFNNSALKFQISQRVSQLSGLDLNIVGDVKIELIPYPAIVANDVFLKNYKPKFFENENLNEMGRVYNIYAESVKVTFPIIPSSNSSLIKKIFFRNVVTESYNIAKQPLNRDNRFTQITTQLTKDAPKQNSTSLEEGISAELFSVDKLSESNLSIMNIPGIEIENGDAIIYDDLGHTKEIKNITFNATIGKNKIYSTGKFTREDITSNFKFLAKFFAQAGEQKSFLEIISPVMEMRLKGDFTSENRGILESDFTGIFEANIFELKTFYRSYITPNGVIASKLRYNSMPLKISAEIESKDKEISISGMAINSPLANGSGDVDINLADKIPMIDIDLDLDNLDIDDLWSKEAVAVNVAADSFQETSEADDTVETIAQAFMKKAIENPQVKNTNPDASAQNTNATTAVKEEKKLEPIDFQMAEKIKNFDLTSEIKIKSAKYLEGEVKDIDLYMTVSKDGQILVLPLIFAVPGEGIFRINGVLDNSKEAPKFVGKFDATGKELKEVVKWLKVESQNLKFDNLKDYTLYSDILLLPNIITLNNFYLNLNNDKTEFLGDLKIDNSNTVPTIVSDFQVSEFNIDDYFLTSDQNVYLSPGLLVKKLLWLNDVPSSNELKMHFDRMIYKTEEFPDQSLKLKFGRGYFEIADLILQSSKGTLKADLVVDISDKNPRFELSASADNFEYITEQRKRLTSENNLSDAEIKKIKQHNFLDQFFALPSLEGFNGRVVLNFDNLKLDEMEIKDFKLSGRMKDGNIENSDLSCTLYDDSPLSFKGLIGIKIDKIVNGNITFTNVLLQDILPDLLEINNISGLTNITASITGAATKKEEFAQNVTGEIKFNSNEPTIDGYGLNDLVKEMFEPQTYAKDLRDPEKILLNPESKTVFNQASGTIQLNGDKEGRVRINVSAPAINGILSGTVSPGNSEIEVLFNTIFLTGTRQKQIPINIATNFKGRPDNLAYSVNIDQVMQYLGLAKKKPADVTATGLASGDESARNIPMPNIPGNSSSQTDQTDKKSQSLSDQDQVSDQDQSPIVPPTFGTQPTSAQNPTPISPQNSLQQKIQPQSQVQQMQPKPQAQSQVQMQPQMQQPQLHQQLAAPIQ